MMSDNLWRAKFKSKKIESLENTEDHLMGENDPVGASNRSKKKKKSWTSITFSRL